MGRGYIGYWMRPLPSGQIKSVGPILNRANHAKNLALAQKLGFSKMGACFRCDPTGIVPPYMRRESFDDEKPGFSKTGVGSISQGRREQMGEAACDAAGTYEKAGILGEKGKRGFPLGAVK